MIRCIAFAALVAGGVPAAASADEVDDSRFLASCLNANLPVGTAAAEQRCVGLLAVSCMNGPTGASADGQARCLSREAEAWERVMTGVWDGLLSKAQAYEQHAAAEINGSEALRRSQQAWENYAEAECTYAEELWADGTYRKVAGADCRMNTRARRAIQLRAQIGFES